MKSAQIEKPDMDCVFDAYSDHLRYLGLQAGNGDWNLYSGIKLLTHGTRHVMTKGFIVPMIVNSMARLHGLHIKAQHRFFTPDHLRVQAGKYQRYLVLDSQFGELVAVDKPITLLPAMYLSLDTNHAYFAPAPAARDYITMALQLSR